MARPQRNNVDYFPFYCEDGEKMFYIEETYGNDGFATFIKLLRELAKVDYHYLNLSKPSSLMFLSAKCKVSKEVLESIINDLTELGKFDKKLWSENKVIWCQDFVDSIQDAYKSRKNTCIDRKGLVLLLEGLGICKPPKLTSKPPKLNVDQQVNPQSKVKETIKDKRKVEIFDNWLSFRNDIKKPIEVESTLKTLAKKFNDNPIEVLEFVINNSIENGWQGLYWDKVPQEHKQKNTTADPVVAEANRQIRLIAEAELRKQQGL